MIIIGPTRPIPQSFNRRRRAVAPRSKMYQNPHHIGLRHTIAAIDRSYIHSMKSGGAGSRASDRGAIPGWAR
jgi:hypothetical protein